MKDNSAMAGGGCYVAGSREQIINTHYQDDSMKEQDAAHSFGGEKKLACKKAIQCLYIVVDESVASDVDNKVSAFVHQLETELTRLRSELQQAKEEIESLRDQINQ